jgi:hypothetical protein
VGDTSTYEFATTRAMDPTSMGEGSHEAMKEGGQGAALPMMPAAGESPAPPPAPLAAHLRYLHR